MFNILTEPHEYMAGYSAIPLRVSSDEVDSKEKFNYLINISLSNSTVITADSYAYGNYSYTKLNFNEEHDFKVGETIMIDDSNGTGFYSNYYTIVLVDSNTSIVCDFTLSVPITSKPTVHRFIPYKMSPNLEKEARVDLSNTLKDYVTQDLRDSNEIYPGYSTRVKYDLYLGDESIEVFNFEDNMFDSGNLSFVNSNLDSSFLSNTQFQIGDVIVIQQNLAVWDYTDNHFSAGHLGFTSSNKHNFRVGQTINISGQETYPSYNGKAVVKDVIDDYNLVTQTSWIDTTPQEGGKILGIPRPEYNDTATITDIYYDSQIGIVIKTDKAFTDSTEPIGGVIKRANGSPLKTLVSKTIKGLNAYNGRTRTDNYGFSTLNFDKYICQNRPANKNNISTILNSTDKYRIEKNSKSWLLVHSDDDVFWEPRLSVYNKSNVLISSYLINFNFNYGSSLNINNYSAYYFGGGNMVNIIFVSNHNLSVGDYIRVYSGPFQGIQRVIDVNAPNKVVINVHYAGESPVGGEYIRKINKPITTTSDYYFPVGFDQLLANTNKEKLQGQDLNTIDTDDISHYSFELQRAGVIKSNKVSFFLNDDCSHYDLFHLLWKDLNGSWLSYPFKYASVETTEVDRKNFYKTEGKWDLENDTFGYETYGRGQTTFFSSSRDKYTVTSGWVKEHENELIKDLMESSSVYMQKPDGSLVAVIISDDEVRYGKENQDSIWNYKFKVDKSNNEVRF